MAQQLQLADGSLESVTIDCELSHIGSSIVFYKNPASRVEVQIPRGDCNILHIPRIISATLTIRAK